MINFLTKKKIIIFLVIFALITTGVYLFIPKTPAPTVISTTPNKGDTEILETSQININFNENISENAKGGLSVVFDPKVDYDSTWLTNTFKVIPKNPLQNNTNYSVKILYNKNEIYAFSFETETFSQKQIQKYGKTQSQMDYTFGQATKKVVEQYPWYTSLPIKTKDYVIYYDFQEQKFAITFLTSKTPDEQKSLIQEALIKIKQIGVKDPVQYYVNNPQP